jgi:hypothetical protein
MARRGNRTEREIPFRGWRLIVVLLHSTGSRIMLKRKSQRAGGACEWMSFVRFAILYCIDKGVPEIRSTPQIIIAYYIIPVNPVNSQ